jgi:putative phosphoribosyl transferase
MFEDRREAGLLLAKEVIKFIGENSKFEKTPIVVLALPRGGVSVALEVALAIGCPLDVIVSKKIGAPEQSELAIGAVTSNGIVVVDSKLQAHLNISDAYVQSEVESLTHQTKQLEDTLRRSAGFEDSVNIDQKCVIVIDDGVATGMTAIAALRSLRRRAVAKLIFATPVISIRTFDVLSQECDRVIALDTPLDFSSVGQFYLDFHQTENQEVIDALMMARKRRPIDQSFAI